MCDVSSGLAPAQCRRFDEVWSLHQKAVYKSCLTWLGGRREDADEAFGRLAVLAYTKCPPEFRNDEHALAWLLVLARNVCIDLHRQRRRAREVSLEGELDGAEERVLPQERNGPPDDPERAYLQRERSRLVRATLRRLGPRLRETVELHVIHDLSYGDVARKLGVSVETVRKRMQLAREVLRQSITRALDGVPLGAADDDTVPLAASEPAVRSLSCVVVEGDDGVERDVALMLGLRRSRRDRRRIAKLEKYIHDHPRGRKRRLEIARVLAASGHLREAIPHYRFASSGGSCGVGAATELVSVCDALARSCDVAISAGGSEEHRRLLEHFIDRRRGAEELASGRIVEACDTLAGVVAADPGDGVAWSLYAGALEADGRFRAAIRCTQEALARDGDNALAIARHLRQRVRAGRVAGAKDRDAVDDLLRRLRRLAPDSAFAMIAAADVLFSRDRAAEAEAMVKQYTNRHPRHAAWFEHLGELQFRRGAFAPALSAARMAWSLDPHSPGAATILCEVARRGSAADARRILDEVRTHFPEHAPVLAQCARIAAILGDSETARLLVSAAIALQPGLASLHLLRGELLRAQRLPDDASAEFRDALGRVPDDDGDAIAAAAAIGLARVTRGEERERWVVVASARAKALEEIDGRKARSLRAKIDALLHPEGRSHGTK